MDQSFLCSVAVWHLLFIVVNSRKHIEKGLCVRILHLLHLLTELYEILLIHLLHLEVGFQPRFEKSARDHVREKSAVQNDMRLCNVVAPLVRVVYFRVLELMFISIKNIALLIAPVLDEIDELLLG